MASLFAFDTEVSGGINGALWGVDEAGRGPLAGPVFAGAACLPAGAETILAGLNDSKKLSEKKREALFQVIQTHCHWAVATASVKEIDELNIMQATFLAMRRAYEKLEAQLGAPPGLLLVDGNLDPGICPKTRCVIGGDGLSACVAAASIVAKVCRDRHMTLLHNEMPQYNFAKHKGYGTALHYQMLEQFGISPEHRRTFLQKWLKK